MIDGIPHVRMNPPLRGRAELIRHISHSGKAPIMICMTSTGLLYKLRKSSKDISIPKPVLMIAGAIIAFVAAFIIKNLFSLIF